MEQDEMVAALEALIFACGEPVTFRELKKVFSRHLKELPEDEREEAVGRVERNKQLLAQKSEEEGRRAATLAAQKKREEQESKARLDAYAAAKRRDERKLRLEREVELARFDAQKTLPMALIVSLVIFIPLVAYVTLQATTSMFKYECLVTIKLNVCIYLCQ